jgi:hypothetical protein
MDNFRKNKPLYKPRKSTRAGKKGMVYVMKNGRKKLIHFGDSSMSDFTKHKDPKRRATYAEVAVFVISKANLQRTIKTVRTTGAEK